MMNKMNFHKICAVEKKISVNNGNMQVHQAPFSNGTASNKKKERERERERERKKNVNLRTI